jgi:YD repeat-containing protein
VDRYNGKYGSGDLASLPQWGQSMPSWVSPPEPAGINHIQSTWRTKFYYNDDREIKKIIHPLGNQVRYKYNSDGQGAHLWSGNGVLSNFTVPTHPKWSWIELGGADVTFTVSGGFGAPAGKDGLTLKVNVPNTSISWMFGVDDYNPGAGTIKISTPWIGLSPLSHNSAYELTLYEFSPDPLGRSRLKELRIRKSGIADTVDTHSSDLVTTYVFNDNSGQLKREIQPNGLIVDYKTIAPKESWGATSSVRTLRPPGSSEGIATGTYMDTHTGRLTSEYSPTDVKTEYKYYDRGAWASASSPGMSRLQWRRVGLSIYARTETYEYDKAGNATKVVPPLAEGETAADRATEYEYNELNQVVKVVHPVAVVHGAGKYRPVEYRYYDANGNLSHEFVQYITWDGNAPGVPTGVATTMDPSTTFSAQKSASAMAATWVETRYEYDMLNRQTKVHHDAIAGSAVTQYVSTTEYGKTGRVKATVSPTGSRTEYVYDERGLVILVHSGANDVGVRGTRYFRYDSNGNLRLSFDENATSFDWALAIAGFSRRHVVRREYDGFDRLVKVTDPLGHYTTVVYDNVGRVISNASYSKDDALMAEEKPIYDDFSRQTGSKRLALRAKDPGVESSDTSPYDSNGPMPGHSGKYAYTESELDVGGRPTTQTTRSAFGDIVTRFDYYNRYTGHDDLRLQGQGQDWVRYSYTKDGRISTKTYLTGTVTWQDGVPDENALFPSYTENYTYDAARNLVSYSIAGTGTTYVYDGMGRVVKETDGNNNVTEFEYDLLGRLVRAIKPHSATSVTSTLITQHEYDADSRVVQSGYYEGGQTGSGHTVTTLVGHEYDARGRLKQTLRPGSRLYKYTYDRASNMTHFSDPVGNYTLDCVYDDRHLLKSRKINVGEGVRGATAESFVYDALGRLIKAANFDGQNRISAVNWYYNSLGQAEIQAEYVFDRSGRQIAVEFIGSSAAEDSFKTISRFDVAGLQIETTYWDKSVLNHTYTGGKLAASNSPDLEFSASYVYGELGLVRRQYGNGIVTTYSPIGDRLGSVRHLGHAPTSSTDEQRPLLWHIARRYDPSGNVTSEWRSHLGKLGRAFRYDKGNRLENSYTLDMGGVVPTYGYVPGSLASYATGTVSNFQSHMEYDLFSRGERDSTTYRVNKSGGPVQIDYSEYDPGSTGAGDELALYQTVDGQAYNYDRGELMAFDPTTGRKYDFDYRGQLCEVRDASNNLIEP